MCVAGAPQVLATNQPMFAQNVAALQGNEKLKFARADVALVDARASRGRKAEKLFEEDGLFSEVAPGWPLLRPGGCGDVAVEVIRPRRR